LLLHPSSFLRGPKRCSLLLERLCAPGGLLAAALLLFEGTLGSGFLGLELLLGPALSLETLLLDPLHLGLVVVPEEGADPDTRDDEHCDETDGPARQLLLLGLDALSLELDPREPLRLLGLCLGLGFLQDPEPLELGLPELSLLLVLASLLVCEAPLLGLPPESLFLFPPLTLLFLTSTTFLFLSCPPGVLLGLESLVLELHQVLERKLDRVFLLVLRHLVDLTYAALPLRPALEMSSVGLSPVRTIDCPLPHDVEKELPISLSLLFREMTYQT